MQGEVLPVARCDTRMIPNSEPLGLKPQVTCDITGPRCCRPRRKYVISLGARLLHLPLQVPFVPRVVYSWSRPSSSAIMTAFHFHFAAHGSADVPLRFSARSRCLISALFIGCRVPRSGIIEFTSAVVLDPCFILSMFIHCHTALATQ